SSDDGWRQRTSQRSLDADPSDGHQRARALAGATKTRRCQYTLRYVAWDDHPTGSSPAIEGAELAVLHPYLRNHVERLAHRRAAPDALAGLVAILQRPNTSKPAVAHKIYPYLLDGISIERLNLEQPSRESGCSDLEFARTVIPATPRVDWRLLRDVVHFACAE